MSVVIRIIGDGASVSVTGASDAYTIPADDAGNRVNYVMIQNGGAAHCTFRIGSVAQTAVASDPLVPTGGAPLIIDLGGNTHMAFLSTAGTNVVVITPVEARYG